MLIPDTIVQHRYRVIRQLGQGGMGTVYEAIDQRLDATVALKECHFTDEQLRKQFEREARLLAKLRHQAITRVIDHFRDQEGQFLVMDFVSGEDLSETLNRNGRGLEVRQVLTWADQVLDALDYLHSQQPPVIHRDIKPQNLKLTGQNRIILLDFGLAKGFAGQLSRVTTSGSIFGYTPNYAPLEQIQGTGTDPRSDIYSTAATFYHLLTGVVPPDVLTRLTQTSDGQTDPLRLAHELRREISRDVASVLNRAMAIGRSQRFDTAAEMRDALQKAAFEHPLPFQAATTLASTIMDSTTKVGLMETAVSPDLAAANQVTEELPVIKSTIAAAVAETLEQDLGPSFETPSTEMFEAPIGEFDRFAVMRKVGIFLMIPVIGLILLLLIFGRW